MFSFLPKVIADICKGYIESCLHPLCNEGSHPLCLEHMKPYLQEKCDECKTILCSSCELKQQEKDNQLRMFFERLDVDNRWMNRLQQKPRETLEILLENYGRSSISETLLLQYIQRVYPTENSGEIGNFLKTMYENLRIHKKPLFFTSFLS